MAVEPGGPKSTADGRTIFWLPIAAESTQNQRPLTARNLDFLLRMAGKEVFERQRMTRNVELGFGEPEKQTLFIVLHSAIDPKVAVRAHLVPQGALIGVTTELLDAESVKLQRRNKVPVGQETEDTILNPGLNLEIPMTYFQFLDHLKALPQLQPVSHQRHF